MPRKRWGIWFEVRLPRRGANRSTSVPACLPNMYLGACLGTGFEVIAPACLSEPFISRIECAVRAGRDLDYSVNY